MGAAIVAKILFSIINMQGDLSYFSLPFIKYMASFFNLNDQRLQLLVNVNFIITADTCVRKEWNPTKLITPEMTAPGIRI